MAAEYYLMHAAYPDFESMRYGQVALVECEGFAWRAGDMFNISAIRKICTDLVTCYPLHYRTIQYCHNNSIMGTILSMMRSVIPSMIHSSVELCCSLAGGRLDDVFLVPDADTARTKLLARLEDSLRRRYENERTFTLA